MAQSLGLSLLAIATIAVSIAVLTTFGLVVKSLQYLTSDLGDQVGLSLYLAKASEAKGYPMVQQLSAWPEVESAKVLTSAQALEEFRQQLGREAVLLQGLPSDVIPASVEVRLKSRLWKREEVEQLAVRMTRLDGVEDVRYGQEDIERLSSLLSAARTTVVILGFALSLSTLLVIYNTIRLTLYARRDEIEIMSLVGATDFFVRAPFVIEGALQGLLGGGVAAVLVFVLQDTLLKWLADELASFSSSGLALEFVSWPLISAMLGAGVLLGFGGSFLAMVAVRRF